LEPKQSSDITERKKMEEALRGQADLLQKTLNSMTDAIFILEAKAPPTAPTILECNHAASLIFGYDRTDLLGKATDFLHVSYETLKEFQSQLYAAVQQKQLPFHLGEFRMKRKDGSIFPSEHYVSQLLNDKGERTGWVSIVRDITERKHMMEELGKLSQFRESIIDNANVWIDVLDENTNILIWNKAAEVISGYSREEVVGHGKIWEWLYPDEQYRKSITDLVADVIQHGRVEEGFETTIRRKDGQTRIISWNERNLLNEQGKSVGSIAIGRDVTERKRVEEALRESEEKYRRLFEQAMDGIALADAETGILLDCNEALAALVGRNRAELIGQHQAILHPRASDASAFSPTFKLHATTHEGQVLETQVITSTGQNREVEIKANLLNLQGRKTLQGIFHDITERKRAEDSLRRRVEELAALQATVLDITGSQDLPILLQTIVERATRLLGAPAGGMYLCDHEKQEVRCVVSYNTPHDYTGTTLKYGEGAAGIVAQTGKPLIIDDYRSWQGRAPVYEEEQPFTVVITVPMIWQDRVTGVIHVLDDTVSRRFTQADLKLLMLFADHAAIAVERKRMEEELRRHSEHLEELVDDRTRKLRQTEKDLRSTEERLEYVLASNPAAIYSGKPRADLSDWDLTYLSEAVVSLLGYEPREFVGHPEFWARILHPEDRPSVLAQIPRLWDEGRFTFEYRMLHKDGDYRWIREEARVTCDPDRKPIEVNGYWIDVTERKRLEEVLAKSQRLATIGELAAMVGHDLRNPLQGIAGAAYYLRTEEKSNLSNEGKEMVQMIQESIEHSDKIINDLLEYSKELHLELSKTNVKSITKDALAKAKIPKGIRVVNTTKSQPPMKLDVHKMRRVFMNLIRNAVEAMPKGGTLTITSSRIGDNLHITFKDTGEGMTRETLAKLWSPLFTTKAKGMGLGLAIIKRFVEAHEGSISVETKLGKGSTFTVALPIKRSLKGEEVKEKRMKRNKRESSS
jgi:PAS domain S-box-containing protein